jgi:threonylcarbamoyladenosine tRNA methylthiotransferase MtaB
MSVPPAGAGDRRPAVALVGLGCRVSRADVEAMAAALDGPWQLAGPGDPADVVVVSTCTVTADAEATARQELRRAARERPGARVVATGCCAERSPGSLGLLPGVAAVLPIREQGAIREHLDRLLLATPLAPGGTGRREGAPARPARDRSLTRARPLVKLQDGCDRRCAYCAVPLARGPSRSLAREEALAAIAAAGTVGHEVVLTGVDLGDWGRPLSPPAELAELLRAVASRRLAGRVRLSSIEPDRFPVAALEDGEASAVLCDDFHLPVQSGSPRLLREMGRAHAGPAAVERAVAAILRRFPGATVGADLLVGFPGETDADFRETVRLVERLPLSRLHVFSFSARPGTAAAARTERVAPEAARERSRELRALGERRWGEQLLRRLGELHEVVVELREGSVAQGRARCGILARWTATGRERRGAALAVRAERRDGRGWSATPAEVAA